MNIYIYIYPLGLRIEATPGITPMEIYEDNKSELSPLFKNDTPYLVLHNNKEASLGKPLYESCTLEYLGYRSTAGSRAYSRTLTFLICAASQRIGLGEVALEHAISLGYYGKFLDSSLQLETAIIAVKEEMIRLIEKDIPITTLRLPSTEAIRYFRERGRHETAELIKAQGKYYTNLLEIDGYLDLVLEHTLPRTGMIHLFDLEEYHNGFLLRLPNRQKRNELYPRIEQPKLFDVFQHHKRLVQFLEAEYATPLNKFIRENKINEIITIAEAVQEKRIAEIADEITRRHKENGLRIVLLAGPSSSGKTTTAKRLKTQLIANFLTPYTVSMDDFFVNRVDTPLDEEGNPDYEDIRSLDLETLNHVVHGLLAGEEVQLPYYNFSTGEREIHSRNKLKLKENDLLLLEGIHGLNPHLLEDIASKDIYRVYVSALTSISLDQHNWISTSDNRLLRRLVRDVKYRDCPPEKTILLWSDVRKGEERWIFPYQEYADAVFNSAMVYELAALRPQAERALLSVPEDSPIHATAQRLIKLLSYFDPIEQNHMPPTSLLREFLGGSSFKY